MNILITGASRGIGLEFVKQLLKKAEVRRIWVTTQNADSIQTLSSLDSTRIRVIHTSVSQDESKSALTEALGNDPLDLLINNAGAYLEEPDDFSKIDLKTILKSFEINALAAMRVCQACLPALKRAKNSKVVQITSLMGSIDDNTSGGAYGYRISKAALNMFNKSFANDHSFLTSVVLHPGWVKTDMGGAGAPTTPSESVKGMIKIIDSLTKEKSGKFFDFEGEEIAW